MKFNPRARLDSSQVQRRSGGGGRAVAGGGGAVALIVVLAVTLLGGGSGGDAVTQALSALDGRSTSGSVEDIEGCTTGADANQRQDCRIVAVVNSIQDFWVAELGDRYETTETNFFTGSVTTAGCGSASSAVGPFYCPADKQVYIDLGFFDVLQTRFGASGGDFAEAYILGHEYGHHVQNLLGIRGDRDQGADSDAVRQELMADCYSGRWAQFATSVPDADTGEILIVELTEADISEALDAAQAVGDDRIQESATGSVNPESWTHGSSEQRQRWFLTGLRSASLDECDTYAASEL